MTTAEIKPKRKYVRKIKTGTPETGESEVNIESAVELTDGVNGTTETEPIEVVKRVEPRPDPSTMGERPAASWAQQIVESRKALSHPLPPGMAFFEAPDGYILMGEDTKDHILLRGYDNGKGLLINKRR